MQSRFIEITRLFYQGQYQQGYNKIQSLVQEKPQSSILYSNKALFLSQVGKEEQAIQDLQRSLELNPINYVAYFNLFSLQIRNNLEEEAFRNLCCALSAMHLIKGRISKSIKNLRESILLASNNIEATVLFSLLSIKMHQYQNAKQVIENALLIYPKSQILKILLLQISKYLDPQTFYSENKVIMQISSKRLKCSLQISENIDLVAQTNQKLTQFNNLYNQINGNTGGITQKVYKLSSALSHNENFMLQKSKIRSTNESVIAQLQDQQFFLSESNLNQIKLFQQKKEEDHMHERVQSLVTAFQSSRNKDISIIQEDEQDRLSLQSQPPKPPQKSRLNLYPKADSNRFKINVIKLSLFQFSSEKPLQNVYCILSYGNYKIKMITSAIPCRQGDCLWNKTFEDIQLENQPANLKLKIYNKKRNQIRDQFIGDFQVLLATADLLRLPVLNREGQQVGTLLLHIQMNESFQ